MNEIETEKLRRLYFPHVKGRRKYRRRPECHARRPSDGHKCRLHAGHDGVHVVISHGRETFEGDWEGVERTTVSGMQDGSCRRSAENR